MAPLWPRRGRTGSPKTTKEKTCNRDKEEKIRNAVVAIWGAATAGNDEKARELARLLHYGQKPWLNSDY